MFGEFFPTVVYHSMIIKEEIGKLIEFAWKKGSYVSCLDNRFGPSVRENLKFMFAAATWEEWHQFNLCNSKECCKMVPSCLMH